MTAPRLIVLALAGALGTCPVVAVEVTMTQDEHDKCEAQGGCEVVTRDFIRGLLQRAYSEGHAAGKSACRSSV